MCLSVKMAPEIYAIHPESEKAKTHFPDVFGVVTHHHYTAHIPI